MTVAALILAGGKATRMGGVAKHSIVIDGKTIFERQVEVLAPRVDEILVSGAEIAGFRSMRDQLGAGPLAGIHAGLGIATDWLLVIACDMPYVTAEIIDQLLAGAHDVDAVAVRDEPLCAAYHVSVRERLEQRLRAGEYRARAFLESLNVRWIDDADLQALRNLNSPADLPD